VWFPRSKIKLENKKAISSIVGGIFFLVLMTSGFTVYYVALDSQSQMLDTQQIIADTEVAKIKEKFVVAASSSGVNNLLSLQVVNTGNNVVEIADVWIINKTGIENATRYDLDYRDVSIPVGYSGNILSNTPLYLISDIYDIKVISSIGTIQAVEYDVAGGSNVLRAQMVAIPQDVRFGENATITLIVTNTGDFPIDTVTANDLDVTPDQCTADPNPIFVGPTNLSPSQSTMFFWDCILNPPIGNVITFTGNATGQLSGVDVDSNNAFDTVTVRDFTGGSGEEIVIKDELFGKPEIFMTFPNTVGENSPGSMAVWGVTIANPTEQTIFINKVVIMAISPRPTSSDVIFSKDCENDNPLNIAPTTDRWDCPEANVFQWSDINNPQPILPKSSFPFLARSPEGNMGSSLPDVMTILIQPLVFSTLGQFSKSGYGTGMHSDDVALPNVYLSDTTASMADANIRTNLNGVIGGNTITLNATIADMDTKSAYKIFADSRLIINVPKEWTSPVWGDTTGFDDLVIQPFPDGSHQLIGNLTSNLDGTGGLARTLQFSVTSPVVQDPKMYVFHILADGQANGKNGPNFAIGPLSEAVVQVCPVGGCP